MQNINYQPLTIVMTKDKNAGRYRLGLTSIFVTKTSPFLHTLNGFYPKVTKEDMKDLAKLRDPGKEQRANRN